MAASLSNFFSIGSTYAQGFIRSSSLDSKTKSTVQVTSFKNVRDIDDDAIRHIAEHYSIKSDSKDDEMEYIPSFSIPMTKSVLTDVSPSGLVFTINQSKDNHPILEINSPSVSLKIDAFDHHGKVQGDTWFGGITWSFDERLVVYVSLSKDGKPETYFEKSCKRQKTSAETDGTNKPFPEQSTRVKNEYKEDMGEKFDGVDGMYINVLDTYTGRIVSFWRGESDSIMGCPVFVPSPAGTYYLVYTHWSSFPRRLGAVFCHNRPCTMHLIDVSTFVTATSFQTFKSLIDLDAPEINSVHQRIASVLAIARQVRFTPDEKTAVILGRREFCSSHNYCYELYKCDVITNVDGKLTLSEPVLVVPIVETPQNGSSFPGLFVDSLPVRPFLDSNRIVITSTYLSTDSVVCVDLHTGAVTRLNKAIISSLSHISDDTVTVSNNSWNSLDHASCTVLDVYPVAGELYSGYILCTLSTPLSPQRLGLLAIKKDSSEQDIQSYRGWRSPLQQRYFSVSNKAQLQGTSSSPVTTITQSVDDVDKQLKTMSWKVFEFFATSTQDMSSLTSRPLFDNRFEVIVITPPLTPSDGKEEELPVILVPHGGPHSCTVTQYFPAYAFLCAQLRAIIIHVNYRGSLGFGQSSIDSLPGNIGVNDVSDMVQSLHGVTDYFNNNSNQKPSFRVDLKRVAIVGGSHGGFLAGQLISQFSDMFRVSVMRNPVTNIPFMTASSDIPDWCHVEVRGKSCYDFSSCAAPSLQAMESMYKKSPLALVDRVKTPTLFVLGGHDRRVPPAQGLEYYHILRSRGVPVQVMWFPEDNHSIDRPASEIEQWMATLMWIEKYNKD